MPKQDIADDTAAQAARILHEDDVSPLVKSIEQQLLNKLWVLFYAKDRDLALLQLLESMHLLRDREAERVAEEQRIASLRVFGAARSDREDAYRSLTCRVAAWSGMPGAYERLELIEKARDDKEYQELTRRFESDELPKLVQAWREERRATAEARVERVARLLDPKRKTVPMAALREALGLDEDAA